VSGVLRIAVVVFTAAMLQVTIVSSLDVLGGSPDLLLVTLVSIGLIRGSVTGAVAGFAGGLLVDVATLGTLGVYALLLTIAGYWAGRYGETTGRDRPQAPLLAAAALTVGVAVGGFVLNFMLGADVSARHALVETLAPALILNVALALPVFAACKALIPPTEPSRAREVEFGV
jgi:rod shape-determining protein MreD